MQIGFQVGASRIHGQGVFARQPLTTGTFLLQYRGEKIPKAEARQRVQQGNKYIFELDDRYSIDGQMLNNTARYINHSCDPNCEAQIIKNTIWIVALRDIPAQEELTYNYGYEQRPCHCGAQHCCGYMLDQQYWGLITRKDRA